MRTRAYRARLSLTPDELEAVHAQVEAGYQESEDREFWGKLLDKVERARKRDPRRTERDACAPFDADHVRAAFNFEEDD